MQSQFMPHGHCYFWQTDLILMNLIADTTITLAYYAIPLVLIYVSFRSKGRLPFNSVFQLFAIFILACGTTHLLEVVTIWTPHYYLLAIVKLITAVASVMTALTLIPLMPKILIALKRATHDAALPHDGRRGKEDRG